MHAIPTLKEPASVEIDERDGAFEIHGMHCAACAGTIEAALRAIPGVLRAEVSAASSRAAVRWNTQAANVTKLQAAVRAAGYQAFESTGQAPSDARRQDARRTLWQLFVAGFCMMQVMMLTAPGYLAQPGEIAPDLEALMRWAAWVLTLPAVLFSARPFFSGAWHAVRQRRIGMDVPVALGVVITFIAGSWTTFSPGGPLGSEAYLDSLTMFLSFLLTGRWLEQRARARNTEALESLLRRLPDQAERLRADGSTETVLVCELRVGDRVRVALGQAFPGDGMLTEGTTLVDEALLTGESLPLQRLAGDRIVGGSVNVGSPVVAKLDAVGDATRQQQIARLVERALTERPGFVQTVDRWAGPFLWAVLLLAAGAAAAWSVIDPARAVWVAVSVLIVTCPCALSLATPAALLSAAGNLARRGVLVQRLDAIEALAHVDVACFDKTGTLTQDQLVLSNIALHDEADRTELLAAAASLAALSQHPISQALVRSLGESPRMWREVSETPGQGVEAIDTHGHRWRLGRAAWVGVDAVQRTGHVYLACARQSAVQVGRRPSVVFEFDEALRPDAQRALAALRDQHIAVRILSGDSQANVKSIATRLNVEKAEGGATPEAKLARLSGWQAEGHRIAMVGDGVNDGPVLARADASFAMAQSTRLAQQRADFIMLGNRLTDVPFAVALSRRTLRVVRQNIAWSVVYNAACIPLALAGSLPPWLAGAGMAASSLAVVLNALRLAR